MRNWRLLYRVLSVLALFFGLWSIGRVALAVNQPMGGFLWYYDEAVSGGWIVNWTTGPDWPGIKAGLRPGDQISSIDGRPADEFGEVYRNHSPGERLTYRVRRDGQEIDVPGVPVVRFTWGMLVQGQSVLFAVGLCYWMLSLFIHIATPDDESSYAFSFFLLFVSLPLFFNSFSVAINAPHYPQAFSFFTWKPTFALVAATSIHFATVFPPNTPLLPPPLSKSGLRRAAFIIAGVLIAAYVGTSPPSRLYRWEAWAYTLNLAGVIVGLLACALLFAYSARRAQSFIARQQARAMLVGWFIAALPMMLLLLQFLFPKFPIPSWNILFFFGLALPLSMTHAILHYRLFSMRLFSLRILRYLIPVLGFSFAFFTLFAIVNRIAWLERVQARLLDLTYQPLDLTATICAVLATAFAFWLHNAFETWSTEQFYGLESRLSSILTHLCDRLNVHNGYIALRQGDVFQFRAVHNMPLPHQSLERQEALGREQGIALKIPLRTDAKGYKTLGVVALGDKRDGQPYTPGERMFLDETVSDLLAASLRHIRQLEHFAEAAQVSIRMTMQVQQEERDLQRKLAQKFIAREIGADEVERALRALRKTRRGDPSTLGKAQLTDLRAVQTWLWSKEIEQPNDHQKAQALKAVLLDAIEALKPTSAQSLDDDDWLLYLILTRSFVQGQHWKRLCPELALSQASYFRKRRAAIRALTARLQEQEYG